MATHQSLAGGEFWLPPEFLSDDNINFMDKKGDNATDDGFEGFEYVKKPLLPFDFPYCVFESSVGVSSELSSPVGSADTTESDEEDFITGLTSQMAHSTVEGGFGRKGAAFGTENSKDWVLSGSPNGLPSVYLQPPPSPPWDLLYSAAGDVARMRIYEKAYSFNSHGDGLLLGPPRKQSPVSVPVQNSNYDVGLYQKLQAFQFEHLRQQQMMKRHQRSQPPSPVVHNTGKIHGRSIGLSASARPPLQQSHKQNGSGMRAMFLGNPGSVKRECSGTGVFLPRRAGAPIETRKKSGGSTVLLPERVVQALNLNLEEIGGRSQFQNRFNGGYSNLISNQKRILKPQSGVNNEVRLPQEWTY